MDHRRRLTESEVAVPKKLGDWLDGRYFEGLRNQASERFLRAGLGADVEEAEKGKNAFTLIDASELYCRLVRKAIDQHLGEDELIDCLRDWAEVMVSVGNFLESDEHSLGRRDLYVLDQAAISLRSHIQGLVKENPALGPKLEDALNIKFEGVKSWEALES